MSATAETIIVERPAPTARRRARLEQVPRPAPSPQPGPARARMGVFIAFVLAILTVGLLAMLWINTTLAQGAFILTDLQQQRAQLIEVEQQLRDDLARAESPVAVEEAARALGMVPQDVPVFLRLEDGAILGNPIPQAAPIPEEPVAVEPVAEESVIEEPVAEEPVLP
jgi:hypothetical protein